MAKKVLIVDDSKAMRLIIRRSLRQAGFDDLEVREADNGIAALEALEQSIPDLVLSDWNMPEMTGIELLRRISVGRLKTNFGFITTESTPEMRDVAAAAGALFLIAKPFTAESLHTALTPWLTG